jgi:hypothetical protein
MLTYKNILYSITKIISENFSCDVIVDNQEGIYDGECFYISIIPVNSTASTRTTNQKQLMISLKYFSEDKINHYDVANKLELLFARSLKVKDRFLNISNVEPNFLTDEVGDMLDFLIYVNYFEKANVKISHIENNGDVYLDKDYDESIDIMNSIDVNLK